MAAELDMENEEFYKNLLLGASNNAQDGIPASDSSGDTLIIPQPGFVIKIKYEKDKKIFLNICSSDELPPPKDISEEELTKLINDVDAMNFRMPIGLGSPHAETDKSGKGCTVYDVIINTSFLSKIQKSNYFMGFFMTVVYEGLEEKYNMSLSRDWVMLKNRKSIGQLIPQRIRTKSKPVIQEMDNTNVDTLREVSTKHFSHERKIDLSIPEPSYEIIVEPSVGKVEYLVIEISLPGMKSLEDCSTLDVGDDRLILYVQQNRYHLDLKLPHLVDYESGGAQFNRKTKILTITIPVL